MGAADRRMHDAEGTEQTGTPYVLLRLVVNPSCSLKGPFKRKACSPPLVLREMLMTMMSCHRTPSRMADIPSQAPPLVGGLVERWRPSHYWWGWTRGSRFGRQRDSSSHSRNHLTGQSNSLAVGYSLRRREKHHHTKACVRSS